MRVATVITEGENNELSSLIGSRVTFFCMNYIYTGKVHAVTDSQVHLKDANIVYETGSFDEPAWSDAQKVPRHLNKEGDWFVRISAVESWGVMK